MTFLVIEYVTFIKQMFKQITSEWSSIIDQLEKKKQNENFLILPRVTVPGVCVGGGGGGGLFGLIFAGCRWPLRAPTPL